MVGSVDGRSKRRQLSMFDLHFKIPNNGMSNTSNSMKNQISISSASNLQYLTYHQCFIHLYCFTVNIKYLIQVRVKVTRIQRMA